MTSPRICYFGAYDPAYPRNLILRRGLEAEGASLVECRAPRSLSTLGKTPQLARQFRAAADRCDVILLAEFGQALAPLAWWLARRYGKRLVVDAFTPVYDSAVWDRGVARAGSPAAARYRLIDWLALRLADAVLADTSQHRDYYVETFGARPDRIAVIPVGAAREWFETRPASHEPPGVLVQFYGTYIPLHGIETILRAAARLKDRDDIRFELIGRGQTYKTMRTLTDDLDLDGVTFRDSVPPGGLPGLAARADICLGIFGATPKAARVVPNKVYQALALGKPVITADTPALREMFTPGQHVCAVPAGDDAAMAEAIAALADAPSTRQQLGNAGRARMQAAFTEKALGRTLLGVLERLTG